MIHLDLDLLSKAFRVHVKYLDNQNTWRMNRTPKINGTCSWKITCQPLAHVKSLSKQSSREKTFLKQKFTRLLWSLLAEKGLQICWTPSEEIPGHFIDMIFSNHRKFNGGPIRSCQLYQHLGVAQIFYENSDRLPIELLENRWSFSLNFSRRCYSLLRSCHLSILHIYPSSSPTNDRSTSSMFE